MRGAHLETSAVGRTRGANAALRPRLAFVACLSLLCLFPLFVSLLFAPGTRKAREHSICQFGTALSCLQGMVRAALQTGIFQDRSCPSTLPPSNRGNSFAPFFRTQMACGFERSRAVRQLYRCVSARACLNTHFFHVRGCPFECTFRGFGRSAHGPRADMT